MFTYKTVTTNMSKGLTKGFEKMSEAFEAMGEVFEDIGDTIGEVGDDLHQKFGTMVQNDGSVCITNNNGHVVIEGKVKSLKVNGVDLEVPSGKA